MSINNWEKELEELHQKQGYNQALKEIKEIIKNL